MEQVLEILRKIPTKYYLPLGMGCIGLILLGYGFISMLGIGRSHEKISFESVSSASTSAVLDAKNGQGISIDVEGAVASPSVVTVSSNARIEDAIAAAGGFSSSADKDWIAKHLNLAAKLSDGAKIYIPKVGETQTDSGQSSFTGAEGVVQDSNQQININSATADQLDSLPGVGPVTAQKIINGRPYSSVEDLTKKKIVSTSVYQKIKDSIVAF